MILSMLIHRVASQLHTFELQVVKNIALPIGEISLESADYK